MSLRDGGAAEATGLNVLLTFDFPMVFRWSLSSNFGRIGSPNMFLGYSLVYHGAERSSMGFCMIMALMVFLGWESADCRLR